MNSGIKTKKTYDVIVMIIMIILAILFAFPLYWIITGSFKDVHRLSTTESMHNTGKN